MVNLTLGLSQILSLTLRAQVTALGVIQVGETGTLPANVQFTIDDPNDVQPSVRNSLVSAHASEIPTSRPGDDL